MMNETKLKILLSKSKILLLNLKFSSLCFVDLNTFNLSIVRILCHNFLYWTLNRDIQCIAIKFEY